jgi:hypothetical protein
MFRSQSAIWFQLGMPVLAAHSAASPCTLDTLPRTR